MAQHQTPTTLEKYLEDIIYILRYPAEFDEYQTIHKFKKLPKNTDQELQTKRIVNRIIWYILRLWYTSDNEKIWEFHLYDTWTYITILLEAIKQNNQQKIIDMEKNCKNKEKGDPHLINLIQEIGARTRALIFSEGGS